MAQRGQLVRDCQRTGNEARLRAAEQTCAACLAHTELRTADSCASATPPLTELCFMALLGITFAELFDSKSPPRFSLPSGPCQRLTNLEGRCTMLDSLDQQIGLIQLHQHQHRLKRNHQRLHFTIEPR